METICNATLRGSKEKTEAGGSQQLQSWLKRGLQQQHHATRSLLVPDAVQLGTAMIWRCGSIILPRAVTRRDKEIHIRAWGFSLHTPKSKHWPTLHLVAPGRWALLWWANVWSDTGKRERKKTVYVLWTENIWRGDGNPWGGVCKETEYNEGKDTKYTH